MINLYKILGAGLSVFLGVMFYAYGKPIGGIDNNLFVLLLGIISIVLLLTSPESNKHS